MSDFAQRLRDEVMAETSQRNQPFRSVDMMVCDAVGPLIAAIVELRAEVQALRGDGNAKPVQAQAFNTVAPEDIEDYD